MSAVAVEGVCHWIPAALVGEALAAVAMVNGPWFGAALDVGHRQRATSGRTVRTRACAMSHGHGNSRLIQRVSVQRAVCQGMAVCEPVALVVVPRLACATSVFACVANGGGQSVVAICMSVRHASGAEECECVGGGLPV